jgi:hypothetical protein
MPQSRLFSARTGRRLNLCSPWAQRPVDRRVGANGDQPVLGEFAGHRGRRVLVVGEHLHDDVAVGDHALEAVILPADRHGADVELLHPLGRVEHRFSTSASRVAYAHGPEA